MKITDLALVFVGILLPIIIIVYVNVSYTIKAEEQEMYYNKIINLATQDAANQMKEVEGVDVSVDYGYSGIQNNKIGINPEIAKNIFFNSLYNNFGIKGNKDAESYLQTFVPAIAIIDFDGVYISSKEQNNGNIEHIIKPKKYYSYTYSLDTSTHVIYDGIVSTASSVHTVEFTMSDYITHRSSIHDVKSFYIDDNTNNADLYDSDVDLKKVVIDKLNNIRKEIIINTITKEISNAIERSNSYARNVGISYEFVFPTLTYDEMENAIKNIGVFSFVQGLNNGNRYLNAKSYGVTELQETTKYYFSIFNSDSKYKKNLYHKDTKCPEYALSYHNGDGNTEITPTYVLTKQQAASAGISYKTNSGAISVLKEGFYPCPICNP